MNKQRGMYSRLERQEGQHKGVLQKGDEKEKRNEKIVQTERREKGRWGSGHMELEERKFWWLRKGVKYNESVLDRDGKGLKTRDAEKTRRVARR